MGSTGKKNALIVLKSKIWPISDMATAGAPNVEESLNEEWRRNKGEQKKRIRNPSFF